MNQAQKDGWDLIDEAFEILRQCPFPPHYLENVRSDVLRVCLEAGDPGWRERCYCYLMFFGGGGTATFMKIGVSKSPTCRLAGVTTGNPLEPQWVYAFPFKNRAEAGKAERALHQFHKDRRANGEWFRIDPTQEAQARLIAFGAFREASNHAEPTGPMEKIGEGV